MQMNALQKELDRTKIALLKCKDAVFFTSIIFSLKFSFDDIISTACTNGRYLKFNPKFFLSMSMDERVGVMVHEGCHVAYDHMGRLMGRDQRIWNVAADHAINLDLLARGFKLPSFRLADDRFKDMSTEQIYNILVSEQDKTEPMMADIMAPGEEDSCDPEEHQRHVQSMIMRAAIQSKIANNAPGSIPGEVERFLQRLFKPRLPWKQILRREVQQATKAMYTWTRPNKRYFPGMYLPSLGGYAPVKLRFYVDVSGSVTPHQFEVFVSEMVGALKMMKLEEMTVVQFDTDIKSIDKVTSLKKLSSVKFTGMGGTDPECIFQDIDKYPGSLACIFTDGWFHWRREEIKGRVLWLINDNESFVPRFGRAIHFKTTEHYE